VEKMSNYTNLKKLAITCGGTGGHFYPGLSIAREFKKNGGEVLLVLSGKHAAEQADIAALNDIESIKLNASPIPRSLGTAYKFIHDICSGIVTARSKFKDFKPDALLAMGSFASTPAVIGAIWLRIPLFLHDGNAKIGKANRFFSRWARLLGAGFPPVNRDKLCCPFVFTGMPVRTELLCDTMTKNAALLRINQKFNAALNPLLPTLLIFGGSQGAEIFNHTLPEVLLAAGNGQFQVIHLTGQGKLESVNQDYQAASFPVLILPASNDMNLFYQAADVVFCRSGGSTIAELTLFGKYAFLVPYPYASENHQYYNAKYMSDCGAAVIIDNKRCNKENITAVVERWLAAPQQFIAEGLRGKKLARPDAAVDMLSLIDDKIG
jgi:UDP-N-acetylglucosamine--N-acetylmuramyl-(pentapeptide) pyrophosphoryl-undecaprenol N-acetylglucosamine transferase